MGNVRVKPLGWAALALIWVFVFVSEGGDQHAYLATVLLTTFIMQLKIDD